MQTMMKEMPEFWKTDDEKNTFRRSNSSGTEAGWKTSVVCDAQS
jgi:hypothetical protein